MLGPADIDAWSEDLPPAPTAPTPPTAAERSERRRALVTRLAHGEILTLAEWRDLRSGFLGR